MISARRNTMKIDTMRRAIRLVGLVLPMSWMAGSVAAQMRAATAQAFGVSVNSPTVNQTTPYAVLPTGGDMATDQGQTVDVACLVSAQDAFAIVTGDAETTSGITVNMIHVVLQQPILGILGQVIGYQTVGNIIVGSASSSVN